MTLEEYLAEADREYGLSEGERERLGIEVERCWCAGSHPGCSGWQLALRMPEWLAPLSRRHGRGADAGVVSG